MKLHAETSHEIKFRAEPKDDGRAWEASAFIKPHITINCPELWEWIKEKLNIEESAPANNGKQSR